MRCHRALILAVLISSHGLEASSVGDGSGASKGLEPPPPWINEGILQGADVEPDWSYGISVAIGGDTAAVGAYNMVVDGVRTGGGYIFGRQDGVWVEEHKIEPDDGHEDDRLGWSVAAEGDVVLAGSHNSLVDNEVHQGAVHALVRVAGVWQQSQKILASDGDEQDDFGTALALDGDTLIVGARRKDIAGQEQGAVYVFVLQGGLWTEQAKLFDPDASVSDNFGEEVALDGHTALVGAPAANVDGETNRGAAYVFQRLGTTWTLEQRLLASDGTAVDQFGFSVAIDGHRVLVGAKRKPIDGMSRHGAAYFFERRGTTWTEVQQVLPSNGQAEGEFGLSAALHGDLALIGGETQGNAEQGTVYEFRYNGTSWQETQQIFAPAGPDSFDGFGKALAYDQGRAIFAQIGFGVLGAAWVLREPAIFADGFESRDTSAWSTVVP